MLLVYYSVCLLSKKVGVSMSVCRFDTFENEVEISQMIKKLQDNSIEYLTLQDPWDRVTTCPIKDN